MEIHFLRIRYNFILQKIVLFEVVVVTIIIFIIIICHKLYTRHSCEFAYNGLYIYIYITYTYIIYLTRFEMFLFF